MRSSSAAQGPPFPCLSTLPAQIRQLMGCNTSILVTSPMHINATEMMVSSEMSIGSVFDDGIIGGAKEVVEAAEEAWVISEECS